MHRRRRHVVIAGAALVAALGAGSSARAAAPSCAPVAPGTPRTLLEKVPSLISAELAPTRDGGVVIAFSSFRGSKEFPHSRYTVLALDAAGCTRWRASLPGGWPLLRPLVLGGRSIVVGAPTPAGRSGGAVTLTTLSAATGRVVRKDVLAGTPLPSGLAPVLLGDRRGDIALLLATIQPTGAPGHFEPVTVQLTRRAGATGWTRAVLARGNGAAPAAAVRPDGRLVVGYPRRGHFWLRVGTITGRLGAPIDAGRVTANFRRSDVAIGDDGTVAAVWESTTYGRPWRLRAAVVPAGSRRVAPAGPAVIGAGPAVPGTLESPPAAVAHVGSKGQVTIGFGTPNFGQHIMCVTAGADGRFGSPADVAGTTQDYSNDVPGMLFGPTGNAFAILAGFTPAQDAIINSVVRLDAGCRVRGIVPVEQATGTVVAATVGAGDRLWLLGQNQASVDARRPLRLTIAG